MTGEGERVQFQTYVTSTQAELWRSEADSMDMSHAEYVRTMVQAGRRNFELGPDSSRSEHSDSEERGFKPTTPGVDGLKEGVLEVLHERGAADWDDLLDGVTDDIEGRLDAVLDELQSEDQIRYSGRNGGYTVVDDGR